LAEAVDMVPYLLKLILPRETHEVGVNELYCYCNTRLQFSQKLQDNNNIGADFTFIGVTGLHHSLRTSQIQNKTNTLSPHAILQLSHHQLEYSSYNVIN
jgi:hypothetical protein